MRNIKEIENFSRNLRGAILQKKETAGLVLTETAYAPNMKLPTHIHSQAYFSFVLQGNYQEIYRRSERDCQPFALIFHSEGESHANRFYDSGGRCFNIEIGSQWTERIKLDVLAELESASVKSLARRIYQEFNRFDNFSHLMIEGLFLEMSAEILRRREIRREVIQPWLKRAREILHEQFSENLTIGELAQEVSVHPVHLARSFRQKFHCTVGDYVRNLRVEFACRELSDSNKALAEIAYLAGFSSQSHFTTAFKRLTGATPSEFRKNC